MEHGEIRFRTVRAGARLDRVVFDAGPDPAAPIEQVAVYKCPVCGTVIEFRTADFIRHAGSEHSNLSPDLQRLWLDSRAGEAAEEGQSFLNFACPRCGLAVWIVFRAWHYASGARGFTLTDVVEALPGA